MRRRRLSTSGLSSPGTGLDTRPYLRLRRSGRSAPTVRPHRACPGGATDSSLRRHRPHHSPPPGLPRWSDRFITTRHRPHRSPPPGLPRWSDRFVTTRGNVVAPLRCAAHGTHRSPPPGLPRWSDRFITTRHRPHRSPPPGLPRWSDRFVTTRGNVVAPLRCAAHDTHSGGGGRAGSRLGGATA